MSAIDIRYVELSAMWI